MNVSLPDEMKTFVDDQVATGLYANASDFVRDAIRDRMWSPEALAFELEKGLASGISERSLDDLIAQEFAKSR